METYLREGIGAARVVQPSLLNILGAPFELVAPVGENGLGRDKVCSYKATGISTRS
jgi:hypothetical protein